MKRFWKLVLPLCLCVAMAACLFGGCASAPKQDNVVRISLEGDPEHLDESITNSTLAWWAAAPVNDYVLVFDEDMNIQPGVVEEYNMADELSLYFYVRKGVLFHNGREVAAKDIKYSIERQLDPTLGSYLADSFGCIDSIELLDEYSGIIHLNEPYAPFLSKLTKVAVVPEECADTLKTAPVGCGPFKFVSWKHDQSVTYEKFQDYWKTGYPKADGIEFRILPEYNSQRASLLAGEIDILLWLNNTDIDELEAEDEIYIREQPIMDSYYILSNCNVTPFDDPLVRKAVSLAVDREACIKSAMAGHAAAIYAPVPSDNYYFDESLKYERDVQEAKRLLAEAGYPDGFSIKLTAPLSAVEGQLCDLIQAQLADIGIQAESEKLDIPTFIDRCFAKKEFDMMVCGDSGDGDPETFAYNYLYSNSGTNIASYHNETFDKLMVEGRATFDRELRREIYLEAFQLLKEDSPMVFLTGGYIYSAVRSDVQGLNGFQTQKFDFSSVARVEN